MASNIFKDLREMNKVKFKTIEAHSNMALEKAVNDFLAGDIELVDWKFNYYDGYYMFTCAPIRSYGALITLIKIKLFKPGYTKSELNDFMTTHETLILRWITNAKK